MRRIMGNGLVGSVAAMALAAGMGFFLTEATPAMAEEVGTVPYVGVNGFVEQVAEDEIAGDLGVGSARTRLENGWYVVSKSRTFDERLEVSGDARLILCDGAKLTCKKGIHVSGGNALVVFAQSYGQQMGELDARVGPWDASGCAGIGGNENESAGDIELYGGRVKAQGGDDAAGIGGGENGAGGRIGIYRGSVCAIGNNHGAAIGGGEKGAGGDVTIIGAEVEAYGASRNSSDDTPGGAGIGGGAYGSGGTVDIAHATVTALAYGSAAIGGGLGCGQGGFVDIKNSTVTATGRGGGAAIGGSGAGDGGAVNICDSKVTATSTSEAAGIGGGAEQCLLFANAGNGGNVSIEGASVVDAQSDSGAAIGRGRGADGIGKVKLGDGLRVLDLDNGRKVAPFGERSAYCAYRNHVIVEPA